jgi:hypothetical protein
VIDDQVGAPIQVAWCLSTRQTIEDAICDLRSREGTTVENIGRVRLDPEHPPFADPPTPQDLIVRWARQKNLDAVIWTALKSNFQKRKKQPFSLDAAVPHVRAPSPTAKAKAAEYVWRAPGFVKTPVRSVLQREPSLSAAEPPVYALLGVRLGLAAQSAMTGSGNGFLRFLVIHHLNNSIPAWLASRLIAEKDEAEAVRVTCDK